MKAAVVGLRMGRKHVEAISQAAGLELVGVCDTDPARLSEVSQEFGTTGYTDYGAMLAESGAELVGIAVPNRLHHRMVLQAVEAGVRAVYCEKPIAVNLGEAREMVARCAEAGVPLVFNHQRRTGSDFQWIRNQIESGQIGELSLIRGTCAGDLLSDGTHLIDSTLFLSGDRDWEWIFAAHNRGVTAPGQSAKPTEGQLRSGFDVVDGWRFGHPIEEGMLALCALSGGVRLELSTGDLRIPGTPYHHLEVYGTGGALMRSGDKKPGNLYRMTTEGWRAVEDVEANSSEDSSALIANAYALLAEIARDGRSAADHPMGAPFALRGFELLTAAYESARVRTTLAAPVEQLESPLALELGIAGKSEGT